MLKGYALATEFPVFAQCQVQEILESLEIPPRPEKTPSLLEFAQLHSYMSFEQDLSAVSPNLLGYVRESYLMDDAGLPCLANQEAEWRAKAEGTRKKWDVFLLPEGRTLDYDFMEWSVPVCTDGILVAGTPGRPSYRKEVRMRLGARNSNIYSKSPALIDARGDLKPELTPGRTPPEHTGLNLPPGWQRLSDAFREGLGLLCEKLADYLQRGLAPEIFWKLCAVHGISVGWIPHSALWDVLAVSLTQTSKDTNWQLVRELGDLTFDNATNDDAFVLRDNNGNRVGPDKSLRAWEREGAEHPNLSWQMNSVALLMCCLDIRNGEAILIPTTPDDPKKPLAQYAKNSGIGISMFYVHYTGAAREAVAVETPYPTANRNHALAVVAHESRHASQLTDLQMFAQSFITCIAETVSSRKQTPSMDEPSYWQKRVGHLYFDVQWSQYDMALRPPYKVWTKKMGWISFDETDFTKWRDAPVQID